MNLRNKIDKDAHTKYCDSKEHKYKQWINPCDEITVVDGRRPILRITEPIIIPLDSTFSERSREILREDVAPELTIINLDHDVEWIPVGEDNDTDTSNE
jgi:hypothetical protein